MFWKRATGHGAFAGLLIGTGAAAATHGLTIAEGKGGWLGTAVTTFPSTMAQNFWIAIIAWTSCFVLTIAVSLVTKPKPERELVNLVYGVTELPPPESPVWYRKPIVLASISAALLVILNILFW
jgi:SSS family solute:Na+ symporter